MCVLDISLYEDDMFAACVTHLRSLMEHRDTDFFKSVELFGKAGEILKQAKA